jgi:hypothetical protein
MNEPKIYNIKSLNDSLPIKTGLFIIAIDQVPPHIGLIVNNKYYSFSARGTIIGLPLENQIKKINRLKLASAIVEVDLSLNEEQVISSFQNLSMIEPGQSCFLPILDIFDSQLSMAVDGKYLFNFIPYIYSIEKVKNVYQLNADHLLDANNAIELNVYGQEAINNAITKSRKYAKV